MNEPNYSTFVKQTFHAKVSWIPVGNIFITEEIVDLAHGKLFFNETENIDTFFSQLRLTYLKMTKEIEASMRDYYYLSDYISFLRHKQRYFELILSDSFSKEVDGSIINTNFSVDSRVDQSKYDPCLFLQDSYKEHFKHRYHFLLRATNFLASLIQDTLALKNTPLPLRNPQTIKYRDATPDNPIGFFSHLLRFGGLERMRNEFIPYMADSKHLQPDVLSYDPIEECKVIQYWDEGSEDFIQDTVYFKDVLRETISAQANRCLDAFEEKLEYLILEHIDIRPFLTLQLSKLNLLITISNTDNYQKYSIIYDQLHTLIKTIVGKYKHLLSQEQLLEYKDIAEVELKYSGPLLTIRIGTPEFVSYFGRLIKENKLEIEGVTDVSPIVELLSSVFKIEKRRGEGFVKMSSLHTKFKEYLADNR